MNCYKTHAGRIRAAFEVEPLRVFPAVGMFTLATIQQQFHTVGSILDDWGKFGSQADTCWGMKRDGYEFLSVGEWWKPIALEVHNALEDQDRERAIDTLVAIPGINVVKAAFIAQMLGFKTSCLDTQNIKRLGIDNIQAFAIRPSNTAKTRQAKIRAYLKLCDELGTSEYFWNAWCAQIAEIYPDHFDMDIDVSSYHVEQTLGRLPAEGENEVPF